jgi:hypothetical protein
VSRLLSLVFLSLCLLSLLICSSLHHLV